jgi:hypothetical protein
MLIGVASMPHNPAGKALHLMTWTFVLQGVGNLWNFLTMVLAQSTFYLWLPPFAWGPCTHGC